jgi:lipid II:glycine glycyltransferase (peptidoglycan interpeptide bridge formation enzyme)
MAAFRSACAATGIVAAFLRMHPLLPVPAASDVIDVVRGQTVYTDFAVSHDELWKQTRRGHRAEICKLEKLGFFGMVEDRSVFDDFIAIYLETMIRVDASAGYYFTSEYFYDLRESLSETVHLVTVKAPGGDTAAAGLFLEHDGIVQYYLSGASSQHAALAPSKLMLHTARSWAKDRGNRLFHLGGGLGGASDSLYLFKAGFSELRAKFHTWHIICHPEKYHRLLGARKLQHDPASTFFPEYRKTA